MWFYYNRFPGTVDGSFASLDSYSHTLFYEYRSQISLRRLKLSSLQFALKAHPLHFTHFHYEYLGSLVGICAHSPLAASAFFFSHVWRDTGRL